MNIKIALILTMIVSIMLYGCTYDLEEVENVYQAQAEAVLQNGECEHYFQYAYSVFYANSNTYPSSQYHYVSCAKYGIDPFCDFYPRCERHQCTDDTSLFISSIIAYNGHKYQCIPQKCEICGQAAGYRYLLSEEP